MYMKFVWTITNKISKETEKLLAFEDLSYTF